VKLIQSLLVFASPTTPSCASPLPFLVLVNDSSEAHRALQQDNALFPASFFLHSSFQGRVISQHRSSMPFLYPAITAWAGSHPQTWSTIFQVQTLTNIRSYSLCQSESTTFRLSGIHFSIPTYYVPSCHVSRIVIVLLSIVTLNCAYTAFIFITTRLIVNNGYNFS